MKMRLTITGRRLALAGAAAIVAALGVSWSGLVSIAANTGHFQVVEWFLHSTMRNAVRTQSLPYSLPEGVDLADPSLVRRAAGHFASACSSCHGAPGVLQSPTVLAMMPPPPRLEGQVGRWEDRELFWIVRHGIKYSGMPAWTTQERPDEVWAMVAFLRALPGMGEEEYRTLALGGEGVAGPPSGLSTAGFDGGTQAALADCARCHGLDGLGVGADGSAGAFPVIAGQSEAYLLSALTAYARGERTSGIMEAAAGIHTPDRLAELAAHYAGQPAAGAAGAGAEPRGATLGAEHRARAVRSSGYDEAHLAELGRRIALEGLPERKLPACQSCHGEAGQPAAPSLAGQPEWYIAAQLQLFKEGARGGGPFAHLMEPIAVNLKDEHIDALALHYARVGR
ncbi:c-type cytochrome [Aureimonas populi]|uniref:C-type cytochrome n=1 Tax=Aureimonas populi TaxID=1701758 RepID=A0ABW5CQV0_9HYPH|nr:c-type cytochrome [Aureimonas populi]